MEVLTEGEGRLAAEDVIRGIASVLEKLPTSLTDRVDRVTVHAGRDRAYDAFWSKEYDMPQFRPMAAGGKGTITFFEGRPYSDGLIFRELAHNLPVDERAWREAVTADDVTISVLTHSGSFRTSEFDSVADAEIRASREPRLRPGGVTPYGHDQLVEGNPSEDIAESFRLLMSEQHRSRPFAWQRSADGTERPVPFSEAYPGRTRLLENAADEDLDRDGAVGA